MAGPAPEDPAGDPEDPAADTDDTPASTTRTPATERRRGVEILLDLWTDVARDLVLIGSRGARSVHDTALLDELAAIAASIHPDDAETFLIRVARSAEWLATNVSPELILDTLVLAWPHRAAVA